MSSYALIHVSAAVSVVLIT